MEPNNNTIINQDNLELSTEVLRALAHPLRMKILKFIDQQNEINVNKIYSSLGLEQSITSQHLRILRTAGLVETERHGKYIHYRLSYPKLSSTSNAVERFLKVGG
ncbi:transcriptional regulator [Lewinellaceae bacterium SD302]|nr:transcriptional regulator [Lewinellaceae bacterium SD302]